MNNVVKMIWYFRMAQSHCCFNKDLVLYAWRDGIHTPTYAQLQALLSETPPKYRSNGLIPGQLPKTIEACFIPSISPFQCTISTKSLNFLLSSWEAWVQSLEGLKGIAKASCKEGNFHVCNQ